MSHSKVLKIKKQDRKQDSFYQAQKFVADVLEVLVCIYLLFIIVIMPFYYTDGYVYIGTNKYQFFNAVSSVAAVCILPVFLIYLVLSLYLRFVVEQNRESFFKDFSLTDYFALGYAAVVVLSYLGSDFKEMGNYGSALKGTTGWYMGLISQLFFVGIYFAVSRLWRCRKWIPALWFPVTTIVFLLGYLNRFEVRPLAMQGATEEYISTIGNMNWYCGYLVTVFFMWAYYIWADEKQSCKKHSFLEIWLILGFAALLTQGSLSGMAAMAAMLVVLYLLSMKNEERMQAFWKCLLCMGTAGTITFIIRSIFPDRFNYPDVIADLFTNSPLAIAILVVSAGVWLGIRYFRQKGRLSLAPFRVLGHVGCGVAVVIAAVAILLIIINTALPGRLGTISELSMFRFDLAWGSKRGATWIAGWMCFADQGIWGKLFGVGPDSMASYIESGANSELLLIVRKTFSNLLLTNTHNEWMTILVNTGLLGMISYAGMIISAVVRYLKAGKSSALIGACGFGVLAYTINNMVSFQQAMSTTTMFVILGMGEAFLREKRRK